MNVRRSSLRQWHTEKSGMLVSKTNSELVSLELYPARKAVKSC